jgi:hypothetical protein
MESLSLWGVANVDVLFARRIVAHSCVKEALSLGDIVTNFDIIPDFLINSTQSRLESS